MTEMNKTPAGLVQVTPGEGNGERRERPVVAPTASPEEATLLQTLEA